MLGLNLYAKMFRWYSTLISACCLLLVLIIQCCQKIEPRRAVFVTTGQVTAISYYSCTAGAIIIDLGEGDVQEHGFCWSENKLPEIDGSHINLGPTGAAGQYEGGISGLKAGTHYYLRAYIKDAYGINYGDEIQFNTKGNTIPKLYTILVSNAINTAEGGGEIYDDGGEPITERGVCWGLLPEPTIEEIRTRDGTGTGRFTSSITGLSANTGYYIRAYARNNTGTGYGQDEFLKTYQSTVDDIDGNTYYTLEIGDRTWMAENLRTTHYANGDAIPMVVENVAWSSDQSGAFCYYNNDQESYAETYGALYNWYAMKDNRNVCPSGWHVPQHIEWKIIERELGLADSIIDGHGFRGTIEGGMLKEKDTINWNPPNYAATNETGFTARPGGQRLGNGAFENLGYLGVWWTSKADFINFPDNPGFIRVLSAETGSIGFWWMNVDMGLSIRCVQDTTAQE